MNVIEITDPDQIDKFVRYVHSIVNLFDERGSLYSVRAAIDPVDNGLKFSIDGSVWTPPISGVIHWDLERIMPDAPRDLVDFTRKPAESLALWREHHSDTEIHDMIMNIRSQMGEYYQRYLNEILDLLEKRQP